MLSLDYRLMIYYYKEYHMNKINRIDAIIKTYELNDKYEQVCKAEPDTKKQLEQIENNYTGSSRSYSEKCKATAQQLLMSILNDESLKEIHSARYRIKSLDSLITKYIKKKAILSSKPTSDYNIEKYREMNKDNYHKIITDLIGIRILIRYQQQWEMVHNWIWDNFYHDGKYISNWLNDYPNDSTQDFMAERPKLYLRKQSDLPMYEKIGKGIFDYSISDEGYSSIHYLLWYNGKYVEIQVRTIYDEAWGECTHDLVYKCKNKSKKAELEMLSACLATQTQAASMIADIMFEKSYNNKQIIGGTDATVNDTDFSSSKYDDFHKHLCNMKKNDHREEYNGVIDDGLF